MLAVRLLGKPPKVSISCRVEAKERGATVEKSYSVQLILDAIIKQGCSHKLPLVSFKFL